MGLPRSNDVCGHVDKRHYAKGLCRQCYRHTPQFVAHRHAYYLAHKPDYLAHSRRRQRNGKVAGRLYGLHPATYRRMVEVQGGVCYLCQQPPGKKGLGVDHNHVTGRVRALLCARCNLGIGCLRDNAALCRRAAWYLEAWS